MNLQDLLDESAVSAQTKGFDPTFPEFIALAHSELSEALEEYRKGKGLTDTYYCYPNGEEIDPSFTKTNDKPEGIPSELADVVIRIAHYCGHHQIDLVKAIKDKLAFNKTRPFMHGKKL